MKRLTVLFLLCCGLCWAAPAASDYNLNVHVSATRMVRNRSLSYYQNLIVTIEGKKYEVESLDFPNALLTLGDYKARLIKRSALGGGYDSYRVYEFLLPDNKKRQFVVVGQTE